MRYEIIGCYFYHQSKWIYAAEATAVASHWSSWAGYCSIGTTAPLNTNYLVPETVDTLQLLRMGCWTLEEAPLSNSTLITPSFRWTIPGYCVSRRPVVRVSQCVGSCILKGCFIADFRLYWKVRLSRGTSLVGIVLWLGIRTGVQHLRPLYWSYWVGTTVPSICLFLLSCQRGRCHRCCQLVAEIWNK